MTAASQPEGVPSEDSPSNDILKIAGLDEVDLVFAEFDATREAFLDVCSRYAVEPVEKHLEEAKVRGSQLLDAFSLTLVGIWNSIDDEGDRVATIARVITEDDEGRILRLREIAGPGVEPGALETMAEQGVDLLENLRQGFVECEPKDYFEDIIASYAHDMNADFSNFATVIHKRGANKSAPEKATTTAEQVEATVDEKEAADTPAEATPDTQELLKKIGEHVVQAANKGSEIGASAGATIALAFGTAKMAASTARIIFDTLRGRKS